MSGYDASRNGPPPLQGRPVYSDLPETVPESSYPEVVPVQDHPEVVPFDDTPQVVQVAHEAHKFARGPPPPPGYTNENGFAPGETKEGHHLPPAERTIWGVRRKTFFIFAIAGVILLIATIVGIAVGVTSAKKSSSPAQSAPPPPPPNTTAAFNFPATNLIQGSSLASANFTDSQGHIHLYVYTQDASNALLVSAWDSANRTWETTSISKNLPTGFDLLPQTPISAYVYTNPSFQSRVYVLTTDRVIREFVTTTPSGLDGWRQGPGGLGVSVLIKTHPKSKIAALRPQCGTGEDCRQRFPPVAVAYQDEDGRVKVANANRGWETTDAGLAVDGTVLGLTSLMTAGNITNVNWKLHLQESGTSELSEFSAVKEFPTWTKRRSLGNVPGSEKVKNIAAFSFDLVNIMLLSLGEDGGVNIRTMVSDVWTINQVPSYKGLSDETPPAEAFKFSAIAGNPEKRVFGIVSGNVFEWRFTSTSLISWEFVGKVPTALD